MKTYIKINFYTVFPLKTKIVICIYKKIYVSPHIFYIFL